jgi:hypothetical protein
VSELVEAAPNAPVKDEVASPLEPPPADRAGGSASKWRDRAL